VSDDAARSIARALRAGARGLLIQSAEERRVLAMLDEVADDLGWGIHTWSAAAGIDRRGDRTPVATVLANLDVNAPNALWVIFDACAELREPAARRAFREHAQREQGPTIIAVDPRGLVDGAPLVELIPELWVLRLPPPNREQLTRRLGEIGSLLDAGGFPGAVAVLEDAADRLTGTATGLREQTFDQVLAEAVLEHGLDIDAIDAFIARAKTTSVTSEGLLQPATRAALDELAGLEAFKQWLDRRALALDPRARALGIEPPRGVLLVGVQGCGKSLAARVCPTVLRLPLVRLDLGRLFGGTVGESEANLRAATEAADRLAPVVLWIDEIDKGLLGADRSLGDGGTTARVLGGFLTWLQEREACVFVVATANRVDGLPPELLRRGRLDELFFVDLPAADARANILEIHLERIPARRLGSVPGLADPKAAFQRLARQADGYSGAELQSALTEARLDAFAEHRPLAAADFEAALRATVPLSLTRAEDVEALRAWASTRARRA